MSANYKVQSLRGRILEAIRARCEKRWGPNSDKPLFRETRLGPWEAGQAVMQRLTVLDNGQEMQGIQSMDDRNLKLKIQLILDLEDNWARDGKAVEWSDNIHAIIRDIQNWLPDGCGVIRLEYVGDDPATVVFNGGAAMAEIWVIDFECVYFDDFGSLDKE
jgi:hypothetical protein